MQQRLIKFFRTLEKDKSVTIHHCNLQTLAYEMLKVKKNMAPEILTEIFPQKESNYSLRNSTALQGRSIKTAMYGLETISTLGPKIWDILPTKLKEIMSPTLFKKKIREWAPKIVAVVYVKRTYRTFYFCKGPSIKYYALRRRKGVKAKAYTYCFYDAILLFKSVQEGRGCLKITKFERTYFMDGP